MEVISTPSSNKNPPPTSHEYSKASAVGGCGAVQDLLVLGRFV